MIQEHLALIEALAPANHWVSNGFMFAFGFAAAELLRWVVGALPR
jgi:hypothetical protein